MAVISGVGTEILTSTGQRKISMVDKPEVYDNDMTKLLAILKGRKPIEKQDEFSRQFSWREDDRLVRNSFQVGGATSTAVTINVSTNTGPAGTSPVFRVDDIVLCPRTRELFLVTGGGASDIGVAYRGSGAYGTVAAAALVADDVLIVIGNAKREGSGVRTVLMTTESQVTNYTQLKTAPVKVNWELDGQDLYGGPERRKQQAKALNEHLIDVAFTLWFSQKKLDTSIGSATTGKPRYTTDGIYNLVSGQGAFGAPSSQNPGRLQTITGALTEDQFEDWLRACRRYNKSGEMWIFTSSLGTAVINRFARDKIIPNEMATQEYGFEIMRYKVPGLRVNLVEEKLWEDFTSGANTDGFGRTMICLDMGLVKYHYQRGWDMVLLEDIVKDGTFEYTDTYVSICGLELRLPKAHGILKDFTG